MRLKLGILDQSPISSGMSAEEALANTVKLAQHAERLGYERFWVSEHHDSSALAGSSPEILAAHIAAKTERIRVGSGGVMLPHYSSYKVAENFKVLEGLTPGRIELGIGRAPGGMPRATMALLDGKQRNTDRYPEQVDDLLTHLHDLLKEEDPLYGLKASPVTASVPPVWMLGSSPSSAALAAQKGLPYTFAQFINGEGGPRFAEYYRKHFTPSAYLEKPRNMAAVFAICGETEEEAERIAASLDIFMLMVEQGMPVSGIPSPIQASSYQPSPFELKRIQENRGRMIVGSPSSVKADLLRLSDEYETEEIMIVPVFYDFQDKWKSIELIANECLV